MSNKLRLLTLAILFHATSAMAMPMDYTFEIDWATGPLAATSSTVFITLDGLSSTGNGNFRPSNPPPGRLVNFEVTVGGARFTALNDDDYPVFPQFVVTGNEVDLIGYVGLSAGNMLNLIGKNALFSPIGDTEPRPSFGVIDSASFALAAGVPVPATLALFGLGLAGLGWSRRKKA